MHSQYGSIMELRHHRCHVVIMCRGAAVYFILYPGASNVSVDGTMCSKETPQLASASSNGSGSGKPFKAAASSPPALLRPIPEGEEYSNMTDDEVSNSTATSRQLLFKLQIAVDTSTMILGRIDQDELICLSIYRRYVPTPLSAFLRFLCACHTAVCMYRLGLSRSFTCCCFFFPPAATRRQVVACVATGKLKDHQLEKKLGDHARAVVVRRSLFERRIGRSMENLPVEVKNTPPSMMPDRLFCFVGPTVEKLDVGLYFSPMDDDYDRPNAWLGRSAAASHPMCPVVLVQTQTIVSRFRMKYMGRCCRLLLFSERGDKTGRTI